MENRNSVDQRRHRLEEFFRNFADELRRQGAVVASYRQRGSHRTGPYFRLTVRDRHGRQRAFYLGTEAALVQAARDQLQKLQRGRRLGLVLRRARFVIRREARRCRASANSVLVHWGLQFQGRELRGPVNMALRSITQLTEGVGAQAPTPANTSILEEQGSGTA